MAGICGNNAFRHFYFDRHKSIFGFEQQIDFASISRAQMITVNGQPAILNLFVNFSNNSTFKFMAYGLATSIEQRTLDAGIEKMNFWCFNDIGILLIPLCSRKRSEIWARDRIIEGNI